MSKRTVYAIYAHDRGWLMDLCGHDGFFTGFDTFDQEDKAKTWRTVEDLHRELAACEVELGTLGKHFEIVPLVEVTRDR